MKKPTNTKLRARTLDFAQLDVHGGGKNGIGYGAIFHDCGSWCPSSGGSHAWCSLCQEEFLVNYF